MRKPVRHWLRSKREPTLLEEVVSGVVVLILYWVFVIPMLTQHDPGLRAERRASHAIVRNECPVRDARLNPYEYELQNRYCEVVALRQE